MIKSKFAIIVDNISLSFILFIILYFWINKLLKQSIISLVVSLVLSIIFFIVKVVLSSKKRQKVINGKKEKELFLLSKNNLKYSLINNSLKYLESLLNSKYIGNNVFENEQSYFYINFYNNLNCYDFIIANNFYLQSNKSKSLHFICDSISEEFNNLIENSPVKYQIFYFNDLFEIMKIKNTYPTNIGINRNKNKINLKQIKNKMIDIFTKIKFRDTFFSGISLVLLSIIVPYSLYYLIVGSILLLLSFVSIFVKSIKKNEPPSDNNHNLKELCD